jgi:hypothetical protein
MLSYPVEDYAKDVQLMCRQTDPFNIFAMSKYF